MHMTWIKNRLSAGAAALVVAGGLGVLQPAPAQAAPAPNYWFFVDDTHERCLTGGKIDGATSRVFLTKCNGSNFQKWDWRGDDPDQRPQEQLQNKATGLCLATDNESMENNAVWASQCEWRKGMRFHYDGATNTLCPALTNYSVCLVARPDGAVHSATQGGWMQWWGSPV
ncbi:hypothetical protein [Streptomyces lasiicapitis]|uniref:hypothetical protein n=1 Tax=Streptomyces lasiicapitis TaxID=1923961 RepID=UPI00365040EF